MSGANATGKLKAKNNEYDTRYMGLRPYISESGPTRRGLGSLHEDIGNIEAEVRRTPCPSPRRREKSRE
jgi:hypothetical protein